jgi:hypothetical protein
VTRAMKEFFKVIAALAFVTLIFMLMSGILTALFGRCFLMLITTGFL